MGIMDRTDRQSGMPPQVQARGEQRAQIPSAALEIVPVATPVLLAEVATLFREYAASLGIDLAFQGFEQECAVLPGAYAPPGGCLLLGMRGGATLGCVALHRLDSATCELKRLYVREAERGSGAGRALVMAAIEVARAIGYRAIRLDTLPTMGSAIALYRSLGFAPIAAYRHNPIEETLFLELNLWPQPGL